MSTFKGKNISIEIFGGSHEKFIGAKIFGLPDFDYDYTKLGEFMLRRKPKSELSTSRSEADEISLRHEGGALVVTIENKDVKKADYDDLYGKPRPSHADYAEYVKNGTLDYSGGGRFSGRMTAPLCAAGGLVLQYLESVGISIAAYLYKVGSVEGDNYRLRDLSVKEIESLRGDVIPSLSKNSEMFDEITSVKNRKDSVGGAVDCVIEGNLAGLGDALFDGLEGKLSSLLFAIPAVKSVEFGLGSRFAESYGIEVNDGLCYEGDRVAFLSNNAGGINGGIANGNKITLCATFRPTPSVAKAQRTVDLVNKCDCTIEVGGRHDACVALRAVPAVESAVAIGILDEFLSK